MPPIRSIRDRLAQAIRARRELLGLTQEEAAARSDVSPRYWRRLEDQDPPAVSMEIVDQLLKGLDWSWSELIAAFEPERGVRGDQDDEPPRRLLDAAWRRATPRERDIVTGTLQVITRKRSQRS